jgi:hypothetical protein
MMTEELKEKAVTQCQDLLDLQGEVYLEQDDVLLAKDFISQLNSKMSQDDLEDCINIVSDLLQDYHEELNEEKAIYDLEPYGDTNIKRIIN